MALTAQLKECQIHKSTTQLNELVKKFPSNMMIQGSRKKKKKERGKTSVGYA